MDDFTIREDSESLAQELLPIIVNEDGSPIDILERQEIVGQIMSMLITLSETQSSCTFALNGKWGSGKTFVLNMLERQLWDYQAGDRFIVLHYNCWQYDYYDEPLIAIVSAILDNIDEFNSIISSKVRRLGRIFEKALIWLNQS